MVTQVKKNEMVVLPLFKNGPTLQFFTLTFPSAIHEKLGATAAGGASGGLAAHTHPPGPSYAAYATSYATYATLYATYATL